MSSLVRIRLSPPLFEMSDKSHACNWAEAAQLLYNGDVAHPFHAKVGEFLNSLECGEVLVACSGGADSVFMLCQLWARREEFGVQLVVAHYNHGWRGEDSEEDARFVEEISRQLKCPFVMDTRPEGVLAMTETSARSLRIEFLRAAAQAEGCQCIAFGHQQDDILETQLQRLARGSGTDGLAAPRAVHFFETYPTHIRPLLNLRANTIREALRKHSIPWREDASNQDFTIARNALRYSAIPGLRDVLEHDVSKGAARSRELLEEDAVALDQLARELLPEAFRGSELLKRSALSVVPRALTRRALIAWLSAHRLSDSLSAAAIDQLVDAVSASKADFRLSAGASFIVANASSIKIESEDGLNLLLEPCSLKAGKSVMLSTGALLETELVPVDETLRKRIAKGTIDVHCEAYIAATPEQIFQIRSRQPGDSFRPLGAPGSKKLKNCFIDRQIPVRERNLLPLVVTESGSIAWVPGLPPADDLKINATTKLALKLTYKTRKTTLTD